MKSILSLVLIFAALTAGAQVFDKSEAEISEVLQTEPAFDFILDYEVPTYVMTVQDELQGALEIYRIDYVTVENESKCEYITFDPEISYLEFTGIDCSQPVDDVIDEGLREID